MSKSDFQNLKIGSHFSRSGFLMAFYKENTTSDKTRIGFAVSKKVGKAVKRNKIKRVLREAFRKSEYKELSRDVLITINLKIFKPKEELNYQSLRCNFEKLLSSLK